MFRRVAFLEISKSPLLTAVAGLQSTVYNATKNELLTKFVKGTLKLTENFQEMISDRVPFYYTALLYFLQLSYYKAMQTTVAFSGACF